MSKEFFNKRNITICVLSFISIVIFCLNFSWLESKFLLHDKFYSFMAVIITILVVIIGWFVNSAKARNLQRKQLAISILNDNRYEPKWVDAKHSIWSKIHDSNFTKESWKDLLLKSIDVDAELSEDENALWMDLRTVLNSFEFAAMAVNCRAINGYVVEQSWSHFYKVLYVNLIEAITAIRDKQKEPNLYINFTSMAQEWWPELKKCEGKPSTKTI